MKEEIKSWLLELGYEVEDVGAHELVEGDDYPDSVLLMVEKIKVPNIKIPGISNALGIFFAGSGQGEAMVANRYSGVRAGVYYGGDFEIIRKMREHNNANILSIGARFADLEMVKGAIKEFVNTPFSNDERHIRRLSKFK